MQENVILSKKIYSYIIDEIVSGRLRMGQIIDENKIKDVFNVSKTPIREAIISLENEEVVKKNGKSYFVSFIEPEEIDQIFEARRELESIAAFLAAQRMQRQELKQMENIITKLKDVNGETDPIELANLNGKFHSLIAKASGNKYIESCVNSMR
nr:GntR family transcriptional regulator [Acidiplasma sp.]